MEEPPSKRTLLERLSALLIRAPEDREQLLQLLHSAHQRQLLDADALAIIEGALQVSEMRARDVMIPRSQVDAINVNDPLDKLVPFVIDKAHSRFPVYNDNRDDIIGILLAKDLLHYYASEEFNLRDMLRPAVFIPEAKPLNVLLRDFRANRNHMAIVVDEYGGVAGVVTIEDVLEQIVGDIEDEFDFDEPGDMILSDGDGRFRVKAIAEISDFNEFFGTHFSDAEADTIGGLVLARFARVPKRGDSTDIDHLRFEVLRADSRRIHTLAVTRLPRPETD
jgi:magnesium and cobalt transporter